MNQSIYHSKLNLIETEKAIKLIKDTFEIQLAKNLNLIRVSAPLFVKENSGFNDDLNGVERPVSFDISHIQEPASIVHSLAKWKRYALKRYRFEPHYGLYTDMNAIRRDEEMDALHSIYVDQWDWEKMINEEDRTLDYLKETVQVIYQALLKTQDVLLQNYPSLKSYLPDTIYFITTTELEKMYPQLNSKEREKEICKQHHAVFLMQIGDDLPINHQPHDLRAPDYDDWSLNGDILIYYPPLECAFEISSMGIRVNENKLNEQLKKAKQEHRKTLLYHQMLLNHELPLTIGGGIGQSRICMLLLNKIHIGEVQASLWSDKILKDCEEKGIILL